jgi:hypothetical protein
MFLAFLFLISSANAAEWYRTQSSTPIRSLRNIFVATYMHRGKIDHSIMHGDISFFITVAYDLLQNPSKIYSRVSSNDHESTQNHHMAEEWVIFKYSIQTPVTSTPSRPSLGNQILGDDEYETQMGSIQDDQG